jgi:NitT/TauT family transport system substrate-binding protein
MNPNSRIGSIFYASGFLLLSCCILFGTYLFIQSQNCSDKRLEKISLGSTPTVLSTLIWVAQDRGHFKKAGLDISVKYFDSGFECVQALIDRKIEIACSAEFVTIQPLLEAKDIMIFAAIDRCDDVKLIARKESGITDPKALKNKRVGFTKGTNAEFYLGVLLELSGLTMNDVLITNARPTELANSLEKGDLDAILIWHPFNASVIDRLNHHILYWSAQSHQMEHWVLSSRTDTIRTRSAEIKKIVSALGHAERDMEENTAKAKQIVSRFTGISESRVNQFWEDHMFGVSLPQSLLVVMEDQTRWKISSGQQSLEYKMPNYLNHIYIDGVKKVKPEAVSIINSYKQ